LYTVHNANEHIRLHKHLVKQELKPTYHASAEIGWINDPNGFSYFNSSYHLFYQYHPYSSENGPMHWGHMISKDLIKWEHLPVSMAPDQPYDRSGCFSGSAIAYNGKHVLMYTGHVNPDVNDPSQVRQTQCIAIGDGLTYNKINENPVLTAEHLPAGACIQDFRDPKIWQEGETFYAVIGSLTVDQCGQLLLFRSLDLVNWEYVGVMIHSDNTLGKMWECPDVFPLEEKDVLIVSPQFVERDGDKYLNQHSVVYFVGKLDRETAKFEPDVQDELDFGFDFYAPQTTTDPLGRRIMIGWMQMWDRSIPSHELGHGWSGIMTLPRELRLEGQTLYQQPIEEIANYRTGHVTDSYRFSAGDWIIPGVEGAQVELIVQFTPRGASTFGLKVRKGAEEETVLSYDVSEGKFMLDRSASGHPINAAPGEEGVNNRRQVKVDLINGTLEARVFLDRSSVEVFLQNGLRTMSSTIYPSPSSTSISFFTDGELDIHLDKWDLQI
jgi:beta-fructofuranosidase